MLKIGINMKKYLLMLPAVAMAAVFTGCDEDELNIPQKGVTAIETFYKTDADAEAALAKVYIDTQKNFVFLPETNGYNYGPYFALTNFQADDIFMAGSGPDDCVSEREYHDFRHTYSNNVVLGGYTALYRSIHKCNLVLSNVGDDTPVKRRCRAEARAMRAFAHMVLGIYWGTPPIVDKVLTGADRPTNSESQASVMQWVISEIDQAVPDLDERASTSDQEGTYRITKGFALAVKGKAALWLGDYNTAKTALKQVISSGKYALLPSNEIGKILHADGKGSCESMFEFNYVYVPGSTDGWASAQRNNCNAHMTFTWRSEYFNTMINDKINFNGWGWINPTGDFCRALIANDGIDSPRRKAWIVTYDEMINSAEWAGQWKDASKKGFKDGVEWHGCEGYFCYKNVVHPCQGDIIPTGDRQSRNFPIMRYAEVLLMYAEACAQTGDADGLQYLQAIQNRAGSQTVSTSLTLDAVKKEKRFEMFMEGCRSADLIRWGDVASLEKQDYYTPSFGANGLNEHSSISVDSKYYVNYYGADNLGFKKGKHEFLPFPKDEIDVNPNLVQNPGF